MCYFVCCILYEQFITLLAFKVLHYIFFFFFNFLGAFFHPLIRIATFQAQVLFDQGSHKKFQVSGFSFSGE